MKNIKLINKTTVLFLTLLFTVNLFISFSDVTYLKNVYILAVMVVVFLAVSCLKSHKATGVFYFIVGLLTTFIGEPGSPTGITFILYSIYLFDISIYPMYVISLISVVVILLKSVLLNIGILSTLNILIFYIGVFVMYGIMSFGGGRDGRN